MPIGDNGGGQLNVLVLELGMVTRSYSTVYTTDLKADGGGIDTGAAKVITLAVHPFLVVPSEIRYQDATRSSVRQTTDGALLTKSGRALQQVSLSGTFGVEQRGLGLFVGTGDQRFKRMWHEIVRLGDAISANQVRAEKFPIAAPLLNLALQTYDPELSSFYVNFYDFYHAAYFECQVQSFGFRKSARGGGATGLTNYQMQLVEVGPIVMGAIGTTLLNGLFQSLTTWDQINESIRSFTVTGLVDGLTAAGNLPLAALSDTVSAFNAQIDSAVALLNGYSAPTRQVGALRNPSLTQSSTSTEVAAQSADPENGSTTLQSHLGYATQMESAARDVVEGLLASRPVNTFESDGGAIWWSTLDGEGGIPALDTADSLDTVNAIVDAARWQSAVGALYGMSRAEYAAYLAGSGLGGRLPASSGTTEHRVRPWDTASGLERQYGVPFDDILRQNDLLPDEALQKDRVLLIPQPRPLGPPEAIRGLPVFGSHTGRAAWGADLWLDMRTETTSDGRKRLLICDAGSPGSDDDGAVLIQGIDWLLEQFGDELLRVGAQIPEPVRDEFYAQRLQGLLLSDKRIASVDAVERVPSAGGASVDLRITVSAKSGGTVTAGAT